MRISRLSIAATAASLLVLASAQGVRAQVQSKDQQKCLNTINKDGSLVAKAQGSLTGTCLKGAGKGTLVGSAQSCLTDDAKGMVLAKQNKTVKDATRLCATPPDFGYGGAAAVNAGAIGGKLDLAADLFGANLDAAVIPCGTSKEACTCQQKVLGEVQKVVDKMVGEFVKCKKTVLKNGAAAIADLQSCVTDFFTPGSITADTKGVIAKAFANLDKVIETRCKAEGVSNAAFPVNCTLSSPFFINCLTDRLQCRTCRMLNAIDGMSVDCELWDDGAPSFSCPS